MEITTDQQEPALLHAIEAQKEMGVFIQLKMKTIHSVKHTTAGDEVDLETSALLRKGFCKIC